ncbi:interferon-induced very large GTPase 1-like [Ruditapes philippinarum]|uniref:interferon-induced very large GTPase 1-like n=1 Tax=Ruditapes philippinarum TaxID=129788 RepID=UPI00295A9331|nr:interferon-induced very large GTPase 1-like [Ruditapes philippinarum]
MRTETSSQIIYERGNIASKPDSIGRQAKGEETSSQINVEPVNRLMDERPLKGLGFDVDVDDFVSDTSLVVEPQNIPRIRISGLTENTNKEMLTMFFELEEKKGGGKVKNVEMGNKGKFATIEFEEKAGADAFMLRDPKSILGMDVRVEVFESAFAETAHSNQVERDLARPDSSKAKAFNETEGQTFYQILQRLGLTDKFPGKISMRDVIAVDPNENIEEINGKLSLTDIPWLVLKRLMCAHSESRDIRVPEEENSADSFNLEDSISCFTEIPDVNQDISPLDIFTVVFQCCDPFMKQIFVQKLYLCKLAVPFLYRYWGTNEKHCPVLSVWPLRSLAIESKQSTANKNEMQGSESDVLDLQTKVVAFGRLGRPRYSKSKLINSLLLSQDCKTFFNFDCPSGMTPRQLSNGQIEMFWLPTIDERKDRFQDALTILNLRGDLGQDFSQDLLYFISHLIDSILIIIDLDTVLVHSKMVKDVLLQFSSVILIIADPISHDEIKLLQSFRSAVISSSKSEINLQIVRTHKGTVKQNVVDMLSSITKTILNQLKTNKTMSFVDRLSRAKLATVHSDEEDVVCQQGMLEATEVIKQMKAEGEPSVWKQRLTPVYGKFTKQLGQLSKDRARETDFTEGVNIDEKLNTLRRQQIESITKTVRCFLDILIKSNSSPSVLEYFLCWLHIFIEREKRQILPRLMHENRSAWEKLKELKSADSQVKEEIEKQEIIITDIEENIDEASFAVQHFFREIGHIYEAILQLNVNTEKLRLPNVRLMSSIIGRLVADGHQLELIDGESFYMPYLWIKTVLQKVDICIESSKVMTLGVLGLQSSGKSTLLNTMFGSQFSSRTGRCTRGIHVQLIPTKSEQICKFSNVFSYVLIVDTEGLRSPELSHMQHEHDNELATVITGLGDITMLNIMGENTSEIRDILQVIVHAFLRLKMTNEKLDIRKSCAFIHQNVTDTSASENMVSGLSKLLQTLDEMTNESARSEGILDITTFNQVIEFDINNQVWYLKNLWQGNPPMARVNYEYSETVVDIKCKIMKKALTMKNKSYKSLNDIIEQAHSLWKGVLSEDFVFSFRNSLEIKAYMEMESFVQDELWRLESIIRDKLIQISQNGFATCNRNENLRTVADNLTSGLNECLINEKIQTEANIETYFDGNKYKDIIIQWKNIQQTRVTILCEKLQQIIKGHVEKSQMKRSLEILTDTCQEKHKEELRKNSMDVANRYKGQKLSSQKIDELFSAIWEKTFLDNVDTSPTSTEKHRKKMRIIFRTCLENIFKKHLALLKEALKQTVDLTPLPNVKQLANSFNETEINDTDISFTIFQNIKSAVGWSDTMKYVRDRVNQIFASVDGKIKELCQVNDEVTEMSVNKLLHELDSSIQAILTGESKYNFKKTFYVKIYVHVSRHVHPIFESHNDMYFKTHGTAIILEKYREQQKISFESHLRCRQVEDIVAKLFAHVIESFAEEWTSQSMPNKVTDKLLAKLPDVKNRVIIVICTDLLKEGNFKNFVKYIVDPHMYASSWITEKANQCLDDPKEPVIASTASSLLIEIFGTVSKCVQEVKRKYDGKSPPSIGTWLEYFQNLMTSSYYCIPSERFRNVRQETSSSIENVEYLTTTILDNLRKSEEKLAAKFKLQTSRSVTWAGFNPISRIIKKVWGCKEQCSFCGEPCAKSQDHGDSNHYSIQHRPSCCKGIRNTGTQNACLSSCEFDIQSDLSHTCGVFNYICHAGKRKYCGKTHLYRDYKTYLPNWDIAPTSNMHDSSKYWMWFVATYKDELKNHYNYKIDHIPSSWKNITKSEAQQSLEKIYSA